jgi:hypothetical protein
MKDNIRRALWKHGKGGSRNWRANGCLPFVDRRETVAAKMQITSAQVIIDPLIENYRLACLQLGFLLCALRWHARIAQCVPCASWPRPRSNAESVVCAAAHRRNPNHRYTEHQARNDHFSVGYFRSLSSVVRRRGNVSGSRVDLRALLKFPDLQKERQRLEAAQRQPALSVTDKNYSS